MPPKTYGPLLHSFNGSFSLGKCQFRALPNTKFSRPLLPILRLPFQKQEWRLYHWRYDKGREIDIIAEADRTIVGFEMKTSTAVEDSDFRHLRWFRDDGPGKTWNVIGIVVYMGDRLLSLGQNMYALPLSAFWSFPA